MENQNQETIEKQEEQKPTFEIPTFNHDYKHVMSCMYGDLTEDEANKEIERIDKMEETFIGSLETGKISEDVETIFKTAKNEKELFAMAFTYGKFVLFHNQHPLTQLMKLIPEQ